MKRHNPVRDASRGSGPRTRQRIFELSSRSRTSCIGAFTGVLASAGLFWSTTTNAGSLLEYIRNYDLNDYALGLAATVADSPYAGESPATFAYPYLTSFRDSAFTDDWFLISGGDVGFRWVNEPSWELGLVGRVQTLGLGNSTAPELRGLDDRNWTLEVAPMIGWRGWPVHVNLKSYFETLGRHGGSVSRLSFLLPREYERGYFIPSIEAIYRSSGYNDYYFGITADEARPSRPEYSPGASVSTAVKVRWGYALSDRWLLSGNVGVEFLDDEITASPIVGNDQTWSASVGLAYNSDVFQPRLTDLGNKRQPRLEMRVGAYRVYADSTFTRNTVDGAPGDRIDFENLLDVSESEDVIQLEAIYRFNDWHRIEIGYRELARSGSATLARELSVGDTLFPVGDSVATRVDVETLRLSYAYSLMNDTQKELGIMAGVHITDGLVDISSTGSTRRERTDVSTPLPVVGLHGSVELGKRSYLGARVQAFALEFDRLDGYMLYGTLEWMFRFGESFNAGLAYNANLSELEFSDPDRTGNLRTLHHGPVLIFSAGF